MQFYHPEPPGSALPTYLRKTDLGSSSANICFSRTLRIFPIFIPFAGCEVRCIFCSQEAQTGKSLASASKTCLDALEELKNYPKNSADFPLELAFYGGTFTKLPPRDLEYYLNFAKELKQDGIISAVRASTRPDAVSPKLLNFLKEKNLDTLELGIQSFNETALTASRRLYSPKTALEACQMVKAANLNLGIQLMPGLPAATVESFYQDIELCLQIKPQILRLYPCLVLQNTFLAEEWAKGAFKPWSLEKILDVLPPAILKLWQNQIKVIRLGLAPQTSLQGNFEQQILDGAKHPALGQRLRSKALYLFIKNLIEAKHISNIQALYVPKKFQGEFFGYQNNLKSAYAALGMHSKNTYWSKEDFFEFKL